MTTKKALRKKLNAAQRKLEEQTFSLDTATWTSPSGGWENADNGFGSGTDPTFSTIFLPPYEMSFRELTDMYQNPLMNRIVTLHAGDGTRKGFELVSKDDADKAREIKKEMDQRFNWLALGAKMIGIRHLYGGGVLFADIDDGREPDEPLNENGVRKVWSFQPVESFFAQPISVRPLFQDERPGQPMHYMVTLQAFGSSQAFRCHESRLIRFPSFESDDVISQNERVRRRTWPFSTTQLVYDGIKRYGIGMQSESQLLQSFVEDVFKVSNLKDFKDIAGLQTYIRNVRAIRNSLRATVIGSDDELDKLGTPTTGMGEITKDQRRDVGMISGIPVPLLFSEESGDLGGSTLSESRNVWYDSVESKQENQYQYTPMFWRMLELVSFETGWDIDDLMLVWNPLRSPTESEKVTMRKEQSETDKNYFDMGFPPENIFRSRFGSEEVDLDSMDYDADEFEKELKEMEEEERKFAEQQLKDLQLREEQETIEPDKKVNIDLEE
jgi:phage-related protein (TIGR01555 family)